MRSKEESQIQVCSSWHAKGEHCTYADATNAHSRLQRSVGGLVMRSRNDHELRLVAVDLEQS